MWYEIIPSFALITAAMGIPQVAIYYLNKAVLGNAYRRDLRYSWNRAMYERDRRLTDNPYETWGLESIPDK